MSPTKTDPLPSVDQARTELDKARAKYQKLRDAVVAGDSKVTAKHVADAQDAVEFAELRLELATNADATRDEQIRQARIAELVESLTTGDAAKKGQTLVDLEAKAVAAIEALFLASQDYRDTARNVSQQLGRIGDLPDHVHVKHTNYAPGDVTIDGVRIQATTNFGDWPGNVIRGAIYRALRPHYPSLGDKAKPLVDSAAHALAGGIHDDKVTPTELLAHQLDSLPGTNA